MDRGKIAGVLEVSFEDGSTWAFDVPKVHLKDAQEIARNWRALVSRLVGGA